MSDRHDSPEGARAAKKRDKTARIRDAALALFREKGFEATTTREVAERAGIATGTLFLYVKTKEELVDFVFREEIGRIVERRFATLPGGGLVDALAHVFGGFLSFYARDLTLSRVLLREAFFARAGSEQMAFTFAFMGRVAGLIQAEAERQGATLAAPAPMLAIQAFFLYLGAVLSVTSGSQSAKEATKALASALSIHFTGAGLAVEGTKGVER